MGWITTNYFYVLESIKPEIFRQDKYRLTYREVDFLRPQIYQLDFKQQKISDHNAAINLKASQNDPEITFYLKFDQVHEVLMKTSAQSTGK